MAGEAAGDCARRRSSLINQPGTSGGAIPCGRPGGWGPDTFIAAALAASALDIAHVAADKNPAQPALDRDSAAHLHSMFLEVAAAVVAGSPDCKADRVVGLVADKVVVGMSLVLAAGRAVDMVAVVAMAVESANY